MQDNKASVALPKQSSRQAPGRSNRRYLASDRGTSKRLKTRRQRLRQAVGSEPEALSDTLDVRGEGRPSRPTTQQQGRKLSDVAPEIAGEPGIVEAFSMRVGK